MFCKAAFWTETDIIGLTPMLTMEYKEQSVGDLKIFVAANSIQKPECILASAQFSHDAVHGEVHVIGCSHYATFFLGKKILTEMVACQTPTSTSLLQQTLSETGSIVENLGGVSYHFVARICSVDKVPELPITRSLCSLRFQFPRTKNGEQPLTIVNVMPVASGVRLYTVHHYPNEGKAALTTSIIRGG